MFDWIFPVVLMAGLGMALAAAKQFPIVGVVIAVAVLGAWLWSASKS